MSSPPTKQRKMEDGIENGENVENVEVRFELEYETQFFGFGPKAFIDSIYNVMFNTMQEKMYDLRKIVEEQFPNVISFDEFESVETTMVEWMNEKFKLVEHFVMNQIFAIPPYVSLPEDEVHRDERIKGVKKREVEDAIQDLRKQLISLKFMKDKIELEKQMIEQVRQLQRMVKEKIQKELQLLRRYDEQREVDEDELKNIIEKLNV